jgi:hypothetical protein
MDKYLFIFLICLLPLSSTAQNCGGYYYLTNQAEIQMTTYGEDGTATVTVSSRISKVTAIAGGTASNFQTIVKDKDGKILDQGSGTAKCQQGKLSVDMRQSIPSGSTKQFQDMEVKADQSYIVYPSDMNVGQSLPDAFYHMEIYKKESDKVFATVDYTVNNRKVTGKEKVTPAAGTWDCFKITSDMKMNMKIGIGIPFRFKVTEYFAPDFGIVKILDYNKNGKKMGYTELTAFSK